MAEVIAEELKLPVISKDTIKELLFDNVGFQSREEKVKLGKPWVFRTSDRIRDLCEARDIRRTERLYER